jgi:pyruvate formate lyase activating enzyme
MNIDLKGFTDHYYRDVLGGDRQMVMRFIERAVQSCHVELTTLIVPGENDSDREMREMCTWIAGLGRSIPLHISRFFPRFHMTDRQPTRVSLVYHLAEVAGEQLEYVYTGNC